MDDRKPSISRIARCGQVDADAAPPASVRESSVIYSGSAREVREGFALALRAMGLEAGIVPSDIARSEASSNPEDDALNLAETFAPHATRRPAQ